MSFCNYEPFWIITLYFSMHYWIAKSSKNIFKQHLRQFPYIGCELCTHRCVCVGTINTSFTEEQVSRNLRIGSVLYTGTWTVLDWRMAVCLVFRCVQLCRQLLRLIDCHSGRYIICHVGFKILSLCQPKYLSTFSK